MRRNCQHVLRFTFTLVKTALAVPHAAEIRPQRDIAQLKKSFGQRLHYFIFERAAKQRVWMCDQRDTASTISGIVSNGFQLARRAMDQYFLQGGMMQAAQSASNLQTRDNAPMQQMLFDNLVYIVFVHVGVPHAIRVYNQHRSLVAAVHAAR